MIDSSIDISNISKSASQHINSSTTSTMSNSEKRCQSDSSVSSVYDREVSRNRFNSVDSVQTKKVTNNLLKLSFLNSPRSPLHSSSFNTSSLSDSVFQDAKNLLVERFNKGDLSYEDLNNISQQLIDTSNVSLTDGDLEQLKISFLEHNPLSPKQDTSTEKLSDIQETLKRIKMEELEDDEIKIEKVSPIKPDVKEVTETKSEVEVDNILQKIKCLLKDNNRNDAKKELQRLNDILNEKPKDTLPVPSMIRQDTFDIDPKTGKRKYSNGHQGDGDNSQNDLMEQLAKLLGTHSLDISSLNVSGSSNGGGETKVVVIMPKSLSPNATPVKQAIPSRRSVSMSASQKPKSALRAIENKKLSTPMKHTLTPAAAVTRRSSFTAPRSVTKPPNPYTQNSSMGAVRKSLMPSMDKTPIKQNRNLSPSTRPTTVRRSVSLKSTAAPAMKITAATPTKTRPLTSVPTPSKLATPNIKFPSSTPNTAKRLSTAPVSTRPVASRTPAASKPPSTLSRPITRKTEFKTPYGTASKKPSTAKNGSLV